jgi:transcription antitermination factor NusA-like protein
MYVFEKLKQEGFSTNSDDIRLRTTIQVPRSVTGRLIGKNGQNVNGGHCYSVNVCSL